MASCDPFHFLDMSWAKRPVLQLIVQRSLEVTVWRSESSHGLGIPLVTFPRKRFCAFFHKTFPRKRSHMPRTGSSRIAVALASSSVMHAARGPVAPGSESGHRSRYKW
jgi:hypothetical protein